MKLFIKVNLLYTHYLVHQLLDNLVEVELRAAVLGICVGQLGEGEHRPGYPEQTFNGESYFGLISPTCRSELEQPDRPAGTDISLGLHNGRRISRKG